MIQPQLPLSCPAEAEAPRPPADWQLDEDTRRIGRQGVAAARALLGELSGGDREDRGDRGDRGDGRLDDRRDDRGDDRHHDRQERGRGRAGRAA
jgi:hypothetical protein